MIFIYIKKYELVSDSQSVVRTPLLDYTDVTVTSCLSLKLRVFETQLRFEVRGGNCNVFANSYSYFSFILCQRNNISSVLLSSMFNKSCLQPTCCVFVIRM